MSGEFLGTFTNSVNKSKWITIPAAFKKKFSPSAKQQVVITIGPENNVAIYPLDNWNNKISKLKDCDERSTKLLLNLRTFASSEQKLESTGRIKLSNELIEIAGIQKKVVIKGEGTFISVWCPERYKQYRRKKLEEHQKTFNSLDYQE